MTLYMYVADLVHGLHADREDTDDEMVPLARGDHAAQCLRVGVPVCVAVQLQPG